MNVLDILLLLTFGLGLLLGWKWRAVRLIFFILALAVGVWAANRYQAEFAPAFLRLSAQAGTLLAWLTPFLTAFCLLMLAGVVLGGTLEHLQLHWLDRCVGALLAGGVALALAAGAVLWFRPVAKAAHLNVVERSKLAAPLAAWTRPYWDRSLSILPTVKKLFAADSKPKEF